MKLIFLAVLALLLIVSPCGAQTNQTAWISLAWNPSPAVNMGVINYNLYYGPASATYFFNVTAVCATNGLESGFANEISWTSTPPPTPPTVLRIISGN